MHQAAVRSPGKGKSLKVAAAQASGMSRHALPAPVSHGVPADLQDAAVELGRRRAPLHEPLHRVVVLFDQLEMDRLSVQDQGSSVVRLRVSSYRTLCVRVCVAMYEKRI